VSLYAQVYPVNRFPEKFQIMQMYRVAYAVDPKIYQPGDEVSFGFDLERLKKYGEPDMQASLDQLRKHVHKLWERMNKAQKVMFLLSYLSPGASYLANIVSSIEEVTGISLEGETHGLHMLTGAVTTKTKAVFEELGPDWKMPLKGLGAASWL